GGDRDGNPQVTPEVTRQALAIQTDAVLHVLEAETERIARTATLDAATTPPSAELRRSLAADATASPEVYDAAAASSPGEPHRCKLLLVAARIAATRRRDADLAYRDPSALLADLHLVQHSLATAGATRVAYGELAALRWQVETFGFHLAELEVRQHSRVHRAALTELLAQLPHLREPARAAQDADLLDRLVRFGWPEAVEPDADATRDVLDTLRVLAVLQQRWGERACGRYVVSFSHTAADLVAVPALAAAALAGTPLRLRVVPLFETGADLANAVAALDAWIDLPSTARWLDEHGRRLEVMLGYSDSAKDVGPVSATLVLYDTQAALVDWARSRRIELTLFHGRGGSLGRGGGPVNRAILAQPPGSVTGRFKVTEQGEVIAARYGNSVLARRHLEQVTAAVLRHGTDEVADRNADAARTYAPVAATLNRAACDAYRALVETPGFADWFAAVSPLEELADLRIGSRPARRPGGGERDLGELRAIPWVFAWAQSRVNLPGWYGL
ncbi:MAG TPA: phosphoenolpyruvate carboxylase, partial [Mycobacteriales bacterium]|nr:phosphoenolpyruvate carboxylase [Mycobacteriales bacterium]